MWPPCAIGFPLGLSRGALFKRLVPERKEKSKNRESDYRTVDASDLEPVCLEIQVVEPLGFFRDPCAQTRHVVSFMRADAARVWF